ncbi:M48 family peptidase [Thermococci archaeon]|nr:MAG: M48 family peptidase [Thermococci archaeon]RLF84223.1 MAG: M48 family peptidase [Thermococci archaeon]
MPEIELSGRRIQYEVSVRKVRYMRIYMTPSGKLEIISPTRRVEPFLRAKEKWIITKIEAIEKAKQLSGFPYLGRFYNTGSGEKFKINNNMIKLPHNKKLESTLRVRLREIITPLIQEKAKKLNINVNKVFIRKQKTRWGSCSPKGNLNFNLAMLALPPQLIDYLVSHEVAHLVEMNHSKRFWKLVGKFHPDWKRKRRELKEWWIIVHNNPIWKEILEGGK